MSEFVKSETRRARLYHRCHWCDELIAPGDTYVALTGRDGGHISTSPYHPECHAVLPTDPDDLPPIGAGKRGSPEER